MLMNAIKILQAMSTLSENSLNPNSGSVGVPHGTHEGSWHERHPRESDNVISLALSTSGQERASVVRRPVENRNLADGDNWHPVAGFFQRMVQEAVGEVAEEPRETLSSLDFAELFEFVTKNRQQLLSILHNSIELNEPLGCWV